MKEVTIRLDQYRAANLRWLLRLAIHGSDEYNLIPNIPKVEVKGVQNGDWTGEVLWDLEQGMIDKGMEARCNAGDPPWPLHGWYGGKTTPYARCIKCNKTVNEAEFRQLKLNGVTFVCTCGGQMVAIEQTQRYG